MSNKQETVNTIAAANTPVIPDSDFPIDELTKEQWRTRAKDAEREFMKAARMIVSLGKRVAELEALAWSDDSAPHEFDMPAIIAGISADMAALKKGGK